MFTSVGDITQGWVHIAAEAMTDAERDKAAAINKQVAGYDFRLPSNQAEILGWTITDVTEDESAPPPSPPPGAGFPGGLPPGLARPPGMPFPPR